MSRATATARGLMQLEAPAPRAATPARWLTLPFSDAIALDASRWAQHEAIATSPFQRRDWYVAWDNVATSEERGRAFVLARAAGDGSPGEMIPFATRRRKLGLARAQVLSWASEDLGCPDHLDIPVVADDAVAGLARALLSVEWDALALGNLREDAPGARELVAALVRAGCHVSVRALELCPFIELPPTWEEYLATQSASRRQTIRRKERKLERAYQVVVRDHDASTFEAGWAVLNALHSERWSGVTAFSPDVAEMHRVFAKSLAERGALWLTTLDLNGTPAAAWYGFSEGDTVFFFQSGRANEHQQDSVGQVLMGMMIRRAIGRGFRRFDFLRGDEPYKASWTSSQRMTWEIVVTRPGLRGAWIRAARRVQLATGRARRAAKRALPEGFATLLRRRPAAPATVDA